MAAHEHINPAQKQLFDPATTRARDPGEMSPHEWLAQPNVAYHGTFRHDWEDAPYHHFGDVHAAADRLDTAAQHLKSSPTSRLAYYSGEDIGEWAGDMDAPAEKETHTGQVFARKLDVLHQGRNNSLTDQEANQAHLGALRAEGYEEWETPGSVRQSARADYIWGSQEPESKRRAKAGTRALGMGKAIRYRNDIEQGESGVSHVAPRSAQSTWEADVARSPHASTNAKNYALQRQIKGQVGSVEFPVKRGDHTWQPGLFGGGVPGPRHTEHINKIQFTTED